MHDDSFPEYSVSHYSGIDVPSHPVMLPPPWELASRRGEPQWYVLCTRSRIELIAGLLRRAQGVLTQKKGRFRFILQVDIIRQAVSVEIDASDIRPL